MSSPHACTKPAYQTVKSGQSSICLTKSLLFCAIVAVGEVEVDQQHLPEVDLREFWEWEAKNETPPAKINIQRRDSESRTVLAHHLGGPLGTACDGGGKC